MNFREAAATFRGHRIPNVDVIGRRNVWFALSGVFIILSVIGMLGRGLNFSIEFTGGSLLQFRNQSEATVQDYQRVMAKYGRPDAKVAILGNEVVQIRTESLTELGITPQGSPTPTPSATASPTASPTGTPSASPSPETSPTPTSSPTTGALPVLKGDQLRAELARTAGVSINEINQQDVGPSWGRTISNKMLTGLFIFLALVTLYISFRFEWKMAVSALVALGHDLIITAGIYALVGREVTPETVIAILTILGYSLYDTVVIFDKVKENTESVALVARDTYSGVVNLSLNQTLMRSVNTSLVVLLPIGSLLLFGGQTLKDFAFALFVGVACGTYSSIFLAAPLLAQLKEREPRFQMIRARAQTRATRPGLQAATGKAASTVRSRDRELEPAATVLAVPGGSESRAPVARPRPATARKKRGKPQGKQKRRRR